MASKQTQSTETANWHCSGEKRGAFGMTHALLHSAFDLTRLIRPVFSSSRSNFFLFSSRLPQRTTATSSSAGADRTGRECEVCYRAVGPILRLGWTSRWHHSCSRRTFCLPTHRPLAPVLSGSSTRRTATDANGTHLALLPTSHLRHSHSPPPCRLPLRPRPPLPPLPPLPLLPCASTCTAFRPPRTPRGPSTPGWCRARAAPLLRRFAS